METSVSSTAAPSSPRPVAASTAKLAEALAKAQAEMKPAVKDSTNPHFRSRYADLASVVDACRIPLTSHGLAWSQSILPAEMGWVAVETTLLHCSGESISGICSLPVAQATPQAYGSAITYARRYCLASLVGVVADEDDDGNAASAPAHRPSPPRRGPPQSQPEMVSALEASIQAETEKLRAEILAAKAENQLTALASRLKRLSPGEQASLRKDWTARRDEIRALAATEGRAP